MNRRNYIILALLAAVVVAFIVVDCQRNPHRNPTPTTTLRGKALGTFYQITIKGTPSPSFEARLDSLFLAPSTIDGDPSPDISGLIGQFAHGNEPSHHILYLYAILGEPYKTAERVRQVMSEQYHDAPDGLSGNEDMGQMSAWYILSAMGLYEVEPASGRYWFGSPIVDRAELTVESGIFTIETTNNSDTNIYIKSVKLNGKPYTLPYIDHADIARGGKLTFEMGAQP